MNERLITLKTFSDVNEANLTKSQLETAGIKCEIKNSSFIAANPLLNLAVGGYELQIPESKKAKAIKIIEVR